MSFRRNKTNIQLNKSSRILNRLNAKRSQKEIVKGKSSATLVTASKVAIDDEISEQKKNTTWSPSDEDEAANRLINDIETKYDEYDGIDIEQIKNQIEENKPSKSSLADKTSVDYKTKRREMSRSRNPSMKSIYAQLKLKKDDLDFLHIFVTVGASCQLARKRIYPSLWNLFKNNLLPPNIHIYGFAKTSMTLEELRKRCKDYIKILPGEERKFEEFWKLNHYYIGSYTSRMDFEIFNKELSNYEVSVNQSNRLYYLALPLLLIEGVTQNLKTLCRTPVSKGWTRVIVEKPFGRDAESSEKLTQNLLSICKEEEIYRIDRYLGKEMVQNIIAVRFSNLIFSSTWNRNYIKSVLISITETAGMKNNGRIFDSFGIIRDATQTHLLQILTLIAMERPISIDPEEIRDVKVRLLKCCSPVLLKDVVLGQYTGIEQSPSDSYDDAKTGYIEELEVPRTSTTPTFCTAVVRIKNERWDGVPFILKCGKGLNKTSAEVRIQYKNVPGDIFEDLPKRNEVVIQIEPAEGFYIKATSKFLNDAGEFKETKMADGLAKCGKFSDVYDRLILDVFCGSQMYFVRSDELRQAWRIFTPLLNNIESKKIKPILYKRGSAGPKESDDLIQKNKFNLD